MQFNAGRITSASVMELKIERAVGSNPTLPTNDVS